MAAKNSKPSELTDIPLTLDQGDRAELNASKSEKQKTNSLKRFFRTVKGGNVPSIDSTESANISEENDADEAGSSPEITKSKLSSDSRMSLQARISSYWSNVFKKAPKTAAKQPQSQELDATSTDVEQNQ